MASLHGVNHGHIVVLDPRETHLHGQKTNPWMKRVRRLKQPHCSCVYRVNAPARVLVR